MDAVEEPKPFVVNHQNIRKPRKKQAPSVENIPPEAAPSTPFDPPVENKQPDRSNIPPKPKRTLPPGEFFRYWASIPEREREEWFLVYVYRGLPKCDVTQTLNDNQLRMIAQQKMRKPEVNIDKLTIPIDPDNWQQQSSERYGAGDYGFRLNDQHPSVKTTICFTTVDGESGGMEFRNWDSYPPVLKVEEVVLTEEINQPYLRWAKLKGIKFPGEPGSDPGPDEGQQEQDDMANAAPIVQDALKHAERMTDKVLEMANRKEQAPPPSPAAEAAARAQMGGIETVVEASKQGAKIMGDALKTAMESSIRNSDPSQRLKETIEMAKLLASTRARQRQ